ncbi:MAG: IS66 family transposase [Bdellovibrionaceae bacterium]|nr:IS66 family transposase [Pseudobdellovibrionaceae bacterium]
MQSQEHLQKENKHLREKLEHLHSIIRLLKKHKFGSKSERYEDVSTEQMVFNEIEVESPKAIETEPISYTRKKKGRGKKKLIPSDILRGEVIIYLPKDQEVCPHDGTPLKQIGAVVNEKLKTIATRTSVVVYKRLKYACPCCDGHVAEAKVKSILPGTIVTPELLSFLIFSKFFQALPLYRLEELYHLQGIVLKRSTMARWLVQISQRLIPVWNILEEKVFSIGYVGIDATTVQVLKEEGREAKTKSTMCVRGSPELSIVLFDYDVSSGGGVAKRLVTGYKGALQANAHKGYGTLERHNLTLLGCMMHSRRRFYKAWLEAKKQPGIASEGLAMFKFLYDKEEAYKKMNSTPQERKKWRDKEIAPSMEAIKQWCEWKFKEVLPSSTIGNALSYFINEYDVLRGFLKDGRYEIDNGWVERVIKRFAIGRKNWLFYNTVEGAKSSSVLYSLVLTAKLNGKDPFKVMAEIFKKLTDAETIDDYEILAELLLTASNLQSCHKKEGALIL